MATVTNTIKLPDGSTPSHAAVVIELVASTTTKAAGWVTATDVTILSKVRPTVTNGAWTASLTPNADITPSGTVYKITETADRQQYVHYIDVDSDGGSVFDLLVDPPASLASAASELYTDAAVSAHNLDGATHSGFYRASGTDVAVADGGTGASSAAAARTNLSAARVYRQEYPPVDQVTNDRWVIPSCGHEAVWSGSAWQATTPANNNVAELIGNCTLVLDGAGHDGSTTWTNRGLGGSDLNVTLSGGPTHNSSAGTITFDGVNDKGECLTASDVAFANADFTAVVVASQPSFTTSRFLVSTRNDASVGNSGWALRTDNSTAAAIDLLRSDGSTITSTTATTTRTAGQMHAMFAGRNRVAAQVFHQTDLEAERVETDSVGAMTATSRLNVAFYATVYTACTVRAVLIAPKVLTPAERRLIISFYMGHLENQGRVHGRVADCTASWWCEPRFMHEPVSSTTAVTGVARGGRAVVALVGADGAVTSRASLTSYSSDDHNVPAVWHEDGQPTLVAATGHGDDAVMHVYLAASQGDLELAETELTWPGDLTYSKIVRKPSTDTVCIISRSEIPSVGGTYLVRSTDWGGSWVTSDYVRLTSKSYLTTRYTDDGASLMFIDTDHPIDTTPTMSMYFFSVALSSGAVSKADGTVAANNFWTYAPGDGTTLVANGDKTRIYTSAGDESARLFAVGPSGSAAAMKLDRTAPEDGGTYGVFRFATSVDWSWEPIVASGAPFGYEQSSYVGGMCFGRSDNEVFLCREAAGVWTLERWVKSGGSWSIAEVVLTRSAGVKLARPWLVHGSSNRLIGVTELYRYDDSSYTDFAADTLLIEV